MRNITIEGRGIDKPMKIARLRSPCKWCIVSPCCSKICNDFEVEWANYLFRKNKYERRRNLIRGLEDENGLTVRNTMSPYGIDGFWQKMWKKKLRRRKKELPKNTVLHMCHGGAPELFKLKVPFK